MILLLSVSSVVSAKEGEDKLTYLGVSGGRVFPSALDPESGSIAPPDNTSLSDVDLDKGDFLGLRVGHIFPAPKNVVVELEGFLIEGAGIDDEFFYLHPFGSRANLDADISVKALMFNMIVNKPSGQVHPYAGFGMGWVRFDMKDIKLFLEPGYFWFETGTEVRPMKDMSYNCIGFQGLLGVEFDITDIWALGFGYRYCYAEPEFEDGDDFKFFTTFKAYVFTVGLSYRF